MKDLKESKKEVGLVKNILNKCKYTLQGLKYCFENESSFLLVALSLLFLVLLLILSLLNGLLPLVQWPLLWLLNSLIQRLRRQ